MKTKKFVLEWKNGTGRESAERARSEESLRRGEWSVWQVERVRVRFGQTKSAQWSHANAQNTGERLPHVQ